MDEFRDGALVQTKENFFAPVSTNPLTASVLSEREDLATLYADWERCRRSQPRPHIHQHPEWLAIQDSCRREQDRGTMAVAVHSGDRLAGVAPFTLHRSHWRCRLGYRTILKFPLLLAHFCGEDWGGPDDPQAFESLFCSLADSPQPYQAIRFESLPLHSPLHRFIRESSLVRRNFWVYSPFGTSPHWFIHLPGTAEEYFAKFNSRTRMKQKYYRRKLDEACEGRLRMERVTQRQQVAGFLDKVEQVSARSWQGTRLGQALCNTSTEQERLSAYADRGWLRSYLLMNGDEPIAFVIGYQADGTFYYDQVGYDPAYNSHRPGTTLLCDLLRDLYDPELERPERLDFGYGDNEYKQIYGTTSYEEDNLYLIRKSVYTGAACATQSAFVKFSAGVRTVLDRLKLRSKVRQWLRGRRMALLPAALGWEEAGRALEVCLAMM